MRGLEIRLKSAIKFIYINLAHGKLSDRGGIIKIYFVLLPGTI